MPDEPHRWYLILGQAREGPFSTRDLQQLLAEKAIDRDVFAWHKGLDTWKRLRELDEFRPKRQEQDTGPEPPAESPAGPSSAPASWAEGAWSKLRLLPKLALILAALGLGSGGIYYLANDETAEPPSTDPEIQRLLHPLTTGDDPQAEAALAGLGGRAVPPLLKTLAPDAGPAALPPSRVRRILIAIGPAAIAPLMSQLTALQVGNTDIPTRILITNVLGAIGGLQSIPALAQALDDPDAAVQAQAVESVAKLSTDLTPALLDRLTGPAHNLSPQARKNLARALEHHPHPDVEPALRAMQAYEKDPEIKTTLDQILNRLDKQPQTAPASSPHPAASKPSPAAPASSSPPPQPVDIRVHASAEARATAETPDEKKEHDPEAAQQHADRAETHRNAGDIQSALDEYRLAYELNPLPMYFLIILELEEALADSSATPPPPPPPPPEAEPEPPPAPVTLEEIHAALSARPQQDLTPFRDAPGTWTGAYLRHLGRDGNRDHLLVRGEGGQSFVASLPRGKARALNLKPGDRHTFGGTLQGFKTIRRDSGSELLPVLIVD